MRRAMAVMVLAMAACNPQSPTGSATTASAPSHSISLGSPTVQANSPTTAVVAGCRLPVFNWGEVTTATSTSINGQNGFLSIGSGTFTPDTSGVFTTDSSGRSVSEETPVLYGDNANSSTYDAAFHRWIPTGPEHVLPDGSAYVYELQLADGSYEIHRVSVATAVDRVIAHMAYDNAYQVLAYQPEGVFVVPIVHRSGLAAGLWLLDPETGSIEAVPNSTDGTWAIIRDGAAWGGPGGAAGSTLVRLDLSTGTAVTWFQHPVQGAVFEGFGFGVTLMGFDRAQHPLIEVFPPGHDPSAPQSPGPPQVWLVRAPGAAAQVSGIALDGTNGIGFGISDSRGLWVVGGDGVYLYDDNGFHHMAPLGPASSPNYTVEGGCA